MDASLEPHRVWIESVVGCPRSETVTLEFEFPLPRCFAHLLRLPRQPAAPRTPTTLSAVAKSRPLDPFDLNNADSLRAHGFLTSLALAAEARWA